MPKYPKKTSSKEKWILGKEDVFKISGDNLFCRLCCHTVTCAQKSHMIQHEKSLKHLSKLNNVDRRHHQLQIEECETVSSTQDFNMDLCNALVAANIPWSKLDCAQLKAFLERYCKFKVPHRTTLSKNYLPKCYEKTIELIRKDIGESSIWVCVDETTDSTGRYIANCVSGKLSADMPGVPYLLSCKQLEKTNHATVARFVDDSLSILWPSGIRHSKIKVLYSDSAAYMLKCANDLKVFYPKLIHFTCLAHALNRVCETIRTKYDLVDSLIANTKKIFLKAPLRIQHYKERLPNLPLPPEPVLTRWCTWLKAAIFYSENFDSVKQVVDELDPDSAISIKKAQELFSNDILKSQLIYISTNFRMLVTAITELETQGMPLHQSITILKEVENNINLCPGSTGALVQRKLKNVLLKNPGIGIFKTLAKLYSGEADDTELPPEVLVSEAPLFKFAHATSCDVERSFSIYKNILSDQRHTLSMDNLERIMVCYSNAHSTRSEEDNSA